MRKQQNQLTEKLINYDDNDDFNENNIISTELQEQFLPYKQQQINKTNQQESQLQQNNNYQYENINFNDQNSDNYNNNNQYIPPQIEQNIQINQNNNNDSEYGYENEINNQEQIYSNQNSNLSQNPNQNQDQQQLQQPPLLQYQYQNVNRKLSKIFILAKQNLKTSCIFLMVFSLVKIISPFTVINFQSSTQQENNNNNCSWGYLQTWCILVSLQGFMAIFYYFSLFRMCKIENVMLQIGEDVQHVRFINQEQENDQYQDQNLNQDWDNLSQGYSEIEEEAEEDEDNNEHLLLNEGGLKNTEENNRKIAMLSQQIKFEAKKKGGFVIKGLGNLQFLLGFSLQIWAIVMYFTYQFSDDLFYHQNKEQYNSCNLPAEILLVVLMLFQIYQYFDFYLGIIVFVVFLPFILLFLCYWGAKVFMKKRKNKSVSRKLKAVKYKKDLITQGDHECSICMSEYSDSDKLIFVPCEGRHHFHENCIREWLKVSPNCPLCRKNFTQEDIEQQQNNPLQN